MSLAKKTINSLDLSKSEEIAYQVSEINYHAKSAREALNEFFYHLSKAQYHTHLASEAALAEEGGCHD